MSFLSTILKKLYNIPNEFPFVEYYQLRKKALKNLPLRRNEYFRLYKKFKFNQNLPADPISIDVVITCLEKDAQTLPYCLKTVKKYINHTINTIYIVSPPSAIIEDITQKYKCKFINESTVLNINKRDIKYHVKGKNRSGWLFQQLIKLHVDQISSSRYFFIIDSDTILTKPKTLVSNKKVVLDISDEYHTPYFKAIEMLTGINRAFPVSFVTHMMLFESKKLKTLRLEVENHTQKPFIESILEIIDNNEMSCFSEFELYGSLITHYYPDHYYLKYWLNNTQNLTKTLKTEIESINSEYNSISFHSYNH